MTDADTPRMPEQELWLSRSLGVLQRHDDGFYPLDGMTAPTFHQPEDAVRLIPENRAKRQSEEIALDALQRAASEVLDILGPRYNTGGVHYSIANLARQAAADLLRFDNVRAAFDSWGLDGEQIIRSLVQLAGAKADRV